MKNFKLFFLFIISQVFCTGIFADVFPLIREGKTLGIYFSGDEDQVVKTAFSLFSSDLKTVSGNAALAVSDPNQADVIVATLGKDHPIEKLLNKNKVSTSKISGEWEAFIIQSADAEDGQKLFIIGSDSRGTAYGVMELSRLIGVSPWSWWADVASEKKTELNLPENYFNLQKPSVQYRGIFLNDEDWGLMPWSSRNFEQTANKGQIGPKTYAKIFELLLRLRGNTIWPAMHEATIPFFFVEGNKEMAEKYGMVAGTSHCEPMMRNSAGEWDRSKYGAYNYLTNKETILSYWSERLASVSKNDNFYTVGLRGVHDGRMEGVKGLDNQVRVMEEVFHDQEALLKKYVGPDLNRIPMGFMPYKEVLEIYNHGLKVPEEISMIWCDDNYGYITHFNNEEEAKRSGGAGLYYHNSYWGRPHDYLWLSTTHPALIYWQMKKSWETGTRKLWIMNVGDIKPGEYNLEFFMDLAWNIESIKPNTIYQHLETWLTREFGVEPAKELLPVVKEYYRLAAIRKPEFMGWTYVEEPKIRLTPVVDTEFNPYAFGDEIQNRINAYEAIADKAKELKNKVAADKLPAYYQLIEYPVCASSEMNKKLLYAQKARLYTAHNLPVANEYAAKSENAYNAIAGLTHTYNKDMLKGKWDGMMDFMPRNLPVFKKLEFVDKVNFDTENKVVLWVENEAEPAMSETVSLAPFIKPADNKSFVSVFGKGKSSVVWTIKQKPEWLNVEEECSGLFSEKRLTFAVDWNKAEKGSKEDKCLIDINGKVFTLNVKTLNIDTALPVEANKAIALNAADYTRQSKNSPVAFEGLGHSLKAIELHPDKNGCIEYDFYTVSDGDFVVNSYFIPNHPVDNKQLRYAISIDNEEPQEVKYDAKFRTKKWEANVLRGQSANQTKHRVTKSGKHTLKIYALDEGVVLDQLMIDFYPERKFYEVPVSKN